MNYLPSVSPLKELFFFVWGVQSYALFARPQNLFVVFY